MELEQAAKTRRTIRRFQQRLVPKEEIEKMLDCARFASCASNLQRLRYLVVQEKELVRRIFETTGWAALVRPHRNPEWGISAPLCFIAVIAPVNASASVQADAGAAIQSLELAAWDSGIGCCWLGSFDSEACGRLLDLGEERRILYLVAIGYPAEDPTAEDTVENTRYYLDSADRLHVPKLTTAAITEWR